jgi:hypothetical protein
MAFNRGAGRTTLGQKADPGTRPEARLPSSLRLSLFIFGTTSSINPAELTPECNASMIRHLPATTDKDARLGRHFPHTNKACYDAELSPATSALLRLE